MIIHSPVISGSLTFAEGATFTMPDNGIYSGSFSGSFQGDGSSLTFGGTNIISSSAQLAVDFLDTIGDGVVSGSSQISFTGISDKPSLVSGSSQIDVEQTTNFNSFSASIASTFSGLSSDFDDLVNNPFSQSASSVSVSKSIIPSSLTLDLGSVASPFRDLYLSSASLYINGTQVLSTDAQDLTLTTDVNQSLRLVETGADTITLQTANGDITLVATGTGNIELDAPIQVLAGNKILSSDGNAIVFGDSIDVEGNITLSGTVDSVDIAAFKSAFDTLSGKALVSGSSQILTLVSIDEDNMATNSDTKLPTQQSVKSYVDTKVASLVDSAPGALDTLNELAAALGDDANFSTTVSNTIAGKVSQSLEIIAGDGLSGGGNLTTNRTLDVDGTVLRTTGFGVISGSAQITTLGNLTIGGNLIPNSNETYDLGSSVARWRDLYLSGSTIDLGGTLITKDSNGDINFTDSATQELKKVIVEELQIGTGATARKIQVDETGVLKFTDTSNVSQASSVELPSGIVSSSAQISSLIDLPDLPSGPSIESRIAALEGTDIVVTLTGDVSGVASITNLGDVTISTTVGDDSHNHVISNVDGLQTALDGKVATNSAQALSSASNALTLSSNTLTLTRGDGSTDTVDLSAYLDEDSRAIASGVLNGATGIVTFTRDDSTTFTLDLSDLLDDTNLVTSVAGRTGVITLTTSDVSEGTNLYYTDARVKTKLSAEGVISSSAQITITESQISDLDHYTDTDWDNRLATKSTSNLTEGSNLYYTDARVKTKLSAEGVISSSAQITITESQISDLDHYTDTDFDNRLATKSTTNLTEGTNLYYTDARVKTKLSAEGVISGSEQIQDVIGGMLTGNTETGITVTYQDADGTIDFVVATQSDNNFTTTLKNKLDGIEAGATADQTGAEIKSLYEAEANTNAFTDALLSKLNGIEAGATADQTAEEIQDIVGAMVSTNTESGITVTYDDTAGKLNFSVATQSDENFTSALKTKLDGIEAGADVTDATNVDAAGAVMNSDTSTAAMSFVIDEDTMVSNTATKVPTQQSVKTYVDNKVLGLIDSAPGALDTLNELAAALGDDANFSTTVTNSLAGKAANTITISAGNGLTGGGNLTANRELSMSGTYTGDFAVTGNITATADIVAYASSDERLKKNIELISDPIGKIKQLKGVTWVWKDEASDVAKQSPNVGVIAQDVEKVLPQVVKDRENGYKGVDYGKMVGLLIEAIKDQQKQIDELKSRLK